ncbi:hypothetical protein V2I01_02440 [Micromonospora sp. BRA006-A]|nr:hypothetical protein [Micromonospora sp. BRA006-A]
MTGLGAYPMESWPGSTAVREAVARWLRLVAAGRRAGAVPRRG